MYEENGQADVEQDHHADHDGVWALGKKQNKRSIRGMKRVNVWIYWRIVKICYLQE